MTLFEQCVETAEDQIVGEATPSPRAITHAVLTCLLENTDSVRTADEIRRVLGEPDAPVFVA